MFGLLALTFLGFVSTFGYEVVHPILPLYVEHFGASYATIGFFFSAYSSTWAILQLYTGHLADRYGRKRFVLIGLLIYGLAAIGCALARNFPQLLAFRLLQGIGLGFLGPAMLGLATGFKEKGKTLAFYRSAQTASGVLAPIIGGYLGRISLGLPFLASAAAMGLALGIAYPLHEEGRTEGEAVGFLASARAALSRRDFLLLCLAAFLAELGYVALGIIVPLTGERLGMGTEAIGWIIAAYYVVFTLTQVPIGILSERLARRGILIVCGLMAAMAFAGLFVASSAWQMGLGMGILGATLGAIFVQTGAWVAELAPVDQKSLYMASFDSIIDLSFMIMPALVGPMAGFEVRSPFLFCALLLIGSAVVLAFVPQNLKSEER